MKNTSIIDICNLALGKVGAKAITSLDDDSNEAIALRRIYPHILADELRKHNWGFSIKRINLPTDSEKPLDYTYSYTLPADNLRVVQIGKNTLIHGLNDYINAMQPQYLIEGGKIYINQGAPLFIRYVAYIEDTTLYDSSFINALATKLAIETVELLTQSSTKKAGLQQEYMQTLRDAVRANAIEKAPVIPNDNSWMMARLK